jgi:PAS domain S-box-containing protein
MEDQVKIYQDITNNMQVGLHVYHLEDPDDDTTLRMVATNPAAVMHTGLTEEEVLGKTLEESFPNLRGTNHPQRYAEVARSGKALEFEDTYYSDDKIVNASFAVKVFPLPKNCVGVIFENITKRKQAEEALKSSEQELRTITDNMTDVVVMADVEGRFTYLSESGYHLCGYKPSELLGKNIFDLIHEDDLTSAGAIFQEGVVEDRKDARIEYRVRHKNGDYIWVESIGNLVLDDNGQPSGVLFVSRDITDRKKIEAALQLQGSERAAVDAFTNSVSHDLQAPLRRIEGFSEALLEECPDELSELARDYLQRITRQIGSMKERTDALLKLSRIVSHDITREEVNLSALARAYLKRRCTVEPERQIETAIAPDLVASGDAHLLSIVIENLLHNAWKYTAETEKARIECGSILKDGLTIYFVKDNGAGFDQQRADEIFDPFKKLHSETEYPGIGIGLNLVYRIITRHGGKIWAEGEPGKGACFYFTLP